MTKTTIFDTNKFANRIKTTLQQLESETDAKLSSLMMAKATSKVNGIDRKSLRGALSRLGEGFAVSADILCVK